MTTMRALLTRVCADESGTTVIETAVVAPVLVIMAIGTFETSAMVARQSELQSSAEQATEIALAIVPDTQGELNQIEGKLQESSGLSDARVTIKFQYRCGSSTTVSDTAPTCTEDSLSTYIWVRMTEEYQPVWSEWGFGESFEYEVERTVQVS